VGNGTNRAVATTANGLGSNQATFTVNISDGVFTTTACVIGKIFVDCNGNAIQDEDENEMGIPGVRLYMEDGTFLISDQQGKYSICGLSATTHVFKVDPITLPKGAVMAPSSNRNAHDPDSIFTDLKFGELYRADFIEGSCSADVLKQVRARQKKALDPSQDGVPITPLSAQGGGGSATQGGASAFKEQRQEIIIRFDSEHGQDPFCSSDFTVGNQRPAACSAGQSAGGAVR
jgi:hypothetical protein